MHRRHCGQDLYGFPIFTLTTNVSSSVNLQYRLYPAAQSHLLWQARCYPEFSSPKILKLALRALQQSYTEVGIIQQ